MGDLEHRHPCRLAMHKRRAEELDILAGINSSSEAQRR